MSIFDGMAGILTGVFGGAVTWHPQGQSPVQIAAVFRREPVELTQEDGGSVLLHMPTLRVQVTVAPTIAAGDAIEPQPGQMFRVLNVWPTRSPAADRFVICELESAT